jgi:hypothetical protein
MQTINFFKVLHSGIVKVFELENFGEFELVIERIEI